MARFQRIAALISEKACKICRCDRAKALIAAAAARYLGEVVVGRQQGGLSFSF
jgi:hypothetical protein